MESATGRVTVIQGDKGILGMEMAQRVLWEGHEAVSLLEHGCLLEFG